MNSYALISFYIFYANKEALEGDVNMQLKQAYNRV